MIRLNPFYLGHIMHFKGSGTGWYPAIFEDKIHFFTRLERVLFSSSNGAEEDRYAPKKQEYQQDAQYQVHSPPGHVLKFEIAASMPLYL